MSDLAAAHRPQRRPARRPDRWWHGAGSPGLAGYVLADAASVVALALVLALTVVGEGLETVTGTFVLVLVFGAFYSVPLALVGCTVVHLACLRVTSQSVHVLAAGLVGVATAQLFALLVDGELWFAGSLLGVATAMGRAAVIPLARNR